MSAINISVGFLLFDVADDEVITKAIHRVHCIFLYIYERVSPKLLGIITVVG